MIRKKDWLNSLLYLGRLSKFDCINAYVYEGTCILRQDKCLRCNPPYINGPTRFIVFGIQQGMQVQNGIGLGSAKSEPLGALREGSIPDDTFHSVAVNLVKREPHRSLYILLLTSCPATIPQVMYLASSWSL